MLHHGLRCHIHISADNRTVQFLMLLYNGLQLFRIHHTGSADPLEEISNRGQHGQDNRIAGTFCNAGMEFNIRIQGFLQRMLQIVRILAFLEGFLHPIIDVRQFIQFILILALSRQLNRPEFQRPTNLKDALYLSAVQKQRPGQRHREEIGFPARNIRTLSQAYINHPQDVQYL